MICDMISIATKYVSSPICSELANTKISRATAENVIDIVAAKSFFNELSLILKESITRV